MPNFKVEINRHNKKVMKNQQEPPPSPGCNCRDHPCPLPTQNCQTDHIVYRATVTDENKNVKTYTGQSSYTFKKRFDGHTYTFRHRVQNQPHSQHMCGTCMMRERNMILNGS